MPFAAALLARVPTALLGSNPQRLNSGRLLIRIFSLKTCAAHITHEGHLAAFLIDAHDAASLLDRLAASTDSDSGDAPLPKSNLPTHYFGFHSRIMRGLGGSRVGALTCGEV